MIQPWRSCVVAAPGPSLTEEVVLQLQLSHQTILAVNHAWRRIPHAHALYGCDRKWWENFGPKANEFFGERYSSIGEENPENATLPESHGVTLLRAKMADDFSTTPGVIHFGYGQNSGFQAINVAILLGAQHIILVGFDMRTVNGVEHFWGNYQASPFHAPDFAFFLIGFDKVKDRLPPGVRIVNSTPGSALTTFPMMSFADALDDRLLWYRSHDHAAAG